VHFLFRCSPEPMLYGPRQRGGAMGWGDYIDYQWVAITALLTDLTSDESGPETTAHACARGELREIDAWCVIQSRDYHL
jgi:hypothetical protein